MKLHPLNDKHQIWGSSDTVRIQLGEGGLGVRATVGTRPHGPQLVIWREDLQLWYWAGLSVTRFGIGVGDPRGQKRLRVDCAFHVRHGGPTRYRGSYFGMNNDGQVYLLRTGTFGGLRPKGRLSTFWDKFQGQTATVTYDDSEERVAVVGRIKSKKFCQEVSAFAQEISRIKQEWRDEYNAIKGDDHE